MLDFTFTVTEKYKASKVDQYCIEFLELNICKIFYDYAVCKAVTILWISESCAVVITIFKNRKITPWGGFMVCLWTILLNKGKAYLLEYLSLAIYLYIFYIWPLTLWSYHYVVNECCYFFFFLSRYEVNILPYCYYPVV